MANTELDTGEVQRKRQSQFLSMVVHAMRTPLAGIIWTFKMLLDGDFGSFTGEQKEIIRKAYERSGDMKKLLDEVTEANKNNRQDFVYSFKNTDLEEVLEKAVSPFLEEARIKNVRVIINHPEKPLPNISADENKLALAFQNIIDNAIKYNRPGGTVTLDMASLETAIQVKISDTGIGIPPEAKDRLFDEFFRAPNVKESGISGTGLGLFTSKNIIERHGGEITFESSSQGTTFYVKIPLEVRDSQVGQGNI